LEPVGLFGISCKNGVEKVIHTVRQSVETARNDPEIDQMILLIDYKNAFNNLDREAVLRVFQERAPWAVAYYHWLYSDSQRAYFPCKTVVGNSVPIEVGCIQGEVSGPLAVSLLLKTLWLDYVRSRDMESLEDWNQKALMSILDDVTLISSAQEAADFLLFTALKGPAYGLELSQLKTVAIAANKRSYDAFFDRIAESGISLPMDSANVWRQDQIDGFSALGAPFCCEDLDFSRRFVENKLAGPSALAILNRAKQLTDPQVLFRLLQSTQGLAKEVFYARTCPPEEVSGAFRLREETVMDMVEEMLPFGSPPLDYLAKLQCEQPFRHAGLGLPSVEKHLHAMYAASLGACKVVVNHPATCHVWERLTAPSWDNMVLSSLKPVQQMLESTKGLFSLAEQKAILDWGVSDAPLLQKQLSAVVYANGRKEMFDIIRTMPDREQQSTAHRLNSYSVGPNTPAYQSHLFSQNPFGHNQAAPEEFASILALRLGLPHGPIIYPCPRCPMPKCFELSDAVGEHATKCLCGLSDGFKWHHVESSTNARHNAAAKLICEIATEAGVRSSREQSLHSSENKDGDVVLDPLDSKGYMGPTFIDFSGSSCHAEASIRLVNTETPYWLRPTAHSAEPYRVTDKIEKEKHDSADARVADANAQRQGHKIAYVAFAFNHFGVIGREARPLITALALRMKAHAGKSSRSISPFKEARILGFCSTAVQLATARSIRARVHNPATALAACA
jgi:hypothetical protein